MPTRSRRSLLRSLGAASVGLAGCQTGPSTDSPSETQTASPTDTETATATGTPTASPAHRRCGPATRPDAAWPVPDRSPAGDRYVAGWSGFGEAPSADWTAEAEPREETGSDPRFRQPLVAGDWLYTVLAYVPTPMVADPGRHLLQGRDPATGEVRWTHELPAVPTEPAVFDDTVVLGVEDTVHAVDRTDGTGRWTREFGADVAAVLPTADRLFVRLTGTESTDASVHALAPDGSTLWSRSLDAALFTGPVVGPGHVHVGADDGTVFALEPGDGATAWATTTPRDEREDEFDPYVHDLVATDCGVAAVTDGDVETLDPAGEFAWRAEGTYRELATDGDTVYGATSTGEHADESEVTAFDAASGERSWATTVSADTYAAPVASDGEVYVHGTGDVLALSPDDGSVAWRHGGSVEAMALADDALFVTRESATTARLEVLR